MSKRIFALALVAIPFASVAAPIVPKPGSNAGYLFFPPASTSTSSPEEGLIGCVTTPTVGDTTLSMSAQDWTGYNKPITVNYLMVGGSGGPGPGAGGGGSTAIVKNGTVVAVANGGDAGQTASTSSGSFTVSQTDTVRFVVGGGGGGGATLTDSSAYTDIDGNYTSTVIDYIRGGGGGAGYRGGGAGGSPVTKYSYSGSNITPVVLTATGIEIAAAAGKGATTSNGAGGANIARLAGYFSSGPGASGSTSSGGAPSWCGSCAGVPSGSSVGVLSSTQTNGDNNGQSTVYGQYLGGIGGPLGGAGAPLKFIASVTYATSGYYVSGAASTSVGNQANYSYYLNSPWGYTGATPHGSDTNCGSTIQSNLSNDYTAADLRTGCGASSYDYPSSQANFSLSSYARNIGNAGEIVLLYRALTCRVIPSVK